MRRLIAIAALLLSGLVFAQVRLGQRHHHAVAVVPLHGPPEVLETTE